MNPDLAQPLFDGPVDIVGDVHGEIDALCSLMRHLGYDDGGRPLDGRRLVFLGDLTDRGPDSPSVVQLVRELVASDRAQCVLGNHELNILLERKKHDNHWFFGEESSLDYSDVPTPALLADDKTRHDVLGLVRSLPLALERDDLRVVHACWDDSMVDIARKAISVEGLYNDYFERIEAQCACRPRIDKIDRGLAHQNRNPVKTITSGKERRTETPFVASGKSRYEERVPWWTEYERTSPLCVFGHYAVEVDNQQGDGQALCVDFGVARRWAERQEPAFAGKYRGRLAAVRIPENVLLFDDGEVVQPAFA